ncbi:MAG: SGNH/GDSL hydrolase family protein [Opitutaceae bacterium]|jgi:lysophospholipase L1-like esterase
MSSSLAAPFEVKHILFVGDSITLHAPGPELGWNGNWGMAASREDLDYVHRLAARFAAIQSTPPVLTVHAKGGGTLSGKLADATYLASLAHGSDLIVVQMGENDHTPSVEAFQKPYNDLLQILQSASPSARIICAGVWSPPSGSAGKDRLIRELCQKHGLAFADLSTANAAPSNSAATSGLWTHNGVNWHPGDAGMEAYAEAIWTAFTQNTIPRTTGVSSQSGAPTLPSFPVSFSDETDALSLWSPRIGVLSKNAQGSAMELKSSSSDDAVMVRHTLPVEAYRGRTVKVSARIRTINISVPPNPWNGVKVRLDIQDAEGEHDFPQARITPHTDLTTQAVSFTQRIPENTITLAIDLGLERVSGTLWIEEISITTIP